MDECPQETHMSEFDDAKEADNSEGTSGCTATFHSPELHSDDSVCVKYNQEVEAQCDESGKPFGLWEKDVNNRSRNCVKHSKNSMCAVSEKLKSSVETLNLSNDSCEQDMSDHDSEPLIIDYRLKLFSSQTNIPHQLACEDTNTPTSECQCDETNDSSSQLSSGEEFETTDIVDNVRVKLVESFITCSNSDIIVHNAKLSTDSVKEKNNINFCDIQKSCKDKSGKSVINSMECCSSSGKHFDESSDIKTNESYESSNNNNNNDGTIQQYFSDSTDCSKVIFSECDYHSFSAAQCVQAEDSYLSADIVCDKSELPNKPQSVCCYESSKISKLCNAAIDSKFFNRVTAHNNPKESKYSTEVASNEISYNQIKTEESDYKQLLEEYKFTDDDDEYKQSMGNTGEYKQLEAEIESSYKQTPGNEDDMLLYKLTNSKKNLSSYKQHTGEDVEDMDTEALDEDDVPCVTVSPNIYQSYEEDSMTAHYQTAGLSELVYISAATQYGTNDNHTAAWNPASSSNGSVNSTALRNSQIPNSQTYTTTQNTVTEAATSSAKGQTTTSTCPSASSSSRPSMPAYEDDHKAVLCTGDQTFKPTVSRQPTMVPFLPAGCSRPYVSGINPSMYAGTAMVQGLSGPTVMTSSSVHIAQHLGGATIMQHQSMSTGLNGGLAQATVMQQQAMSSGVQAAAMLQHRTLTSGGQTMLVQQRTMTTGLGGLAQQTVVQQRLATPASIAQAAMFHANAMRHQTLAAQQANAMQHRGIRLFPARMMGNPMMQSQSLGNATLIRGGTANPAALIGQGLVRGANNGAIMQHLVRQRYLGGPIMPGRGMQVVAGRPIRIKMNYPRESMPVDT